VLRFENHDFLPKIIRISLFGRRIRTSTRSIREQCTDRSPLEFSFSEIVCGVYFDIDHFISYALFSSFLALWWGRLLDVAIPDMRISHFFKFRVSPHFNNLFFAFHWVINAIKYGFNHLNLLFHCYTGNSKAKS
jgi:hypothetical protein